MTTSMTGHCDSQGDIICHQTPVDNVVLSTGCDRASRGRLHLCRVAGAVSDADSLPARQNGFLRSISASSLR